MTQEQTATTETVVLFDNGGIADMEGGLGVKIAAFANEEIGSLRVADKILVPTAIARVKKAFSSSGNRTERNTSLTRPERNRS